MNHQQDETKPYYSIREIMPKLGVCECTVRNYIKSGELKAVKFGRAYYVKSEDLSSFMRDFCVLKAVRKERRPF